MKKLSDSEIFLLAIEAAGKKPYVNHSDRQTGIFIGVTVGALMVRDGLSLKEAKEKELVLRNLFYNRWVRNEPLDTAVTA